MIHTVIGFGIVNKAEIDIFLELSCFFLMIQQMLTIWSLVPVPFLNPAWTSRLSWFTYCWGLPWRILRVTLLACEMRAGQVAYSLSVLTLDIIDSMRSHKLLVKWRFCASQKVVMYLFIDRSVQCFLLSLKCTLWRIHDTEITWVYRSFRNILSRNTMHGNSY